MPSRALLVVALLSLAAAAGCHRSGGESAPREATANLPVPSSEIVAPPADAPIGERLLGASSPAPAMTALPPRGSRARPPSPKVRTPADDELPTWVPTSGRLTVVSAHGLRENLGMADP